MSTRPVRLVSLFAVLVAALGCGELPTEREQTVLPSFKPGPAGPSYAALTIPVAPGWSGYAAGDINSAHQTVGPMNPAGNPSQSYQRGAYWVVGGPAVPVPLPILPGVTRSEAHAISESGIIAGRIGKAAVLWRPSGSDWQIEVRADNGVANGIRDDGIAVGTMWDPVDMTIPPQPVVWDATGVPDTLPLPAGGPYTGGTALAINAQGDVAGTLEIWTFGSSTIYGALWVREGDGYVPLVMQTGWSRGLSDRTTSGQVYVTSSGVHDAYRHRFTRSGTGQWSSDSTHVDGTAQRMNAVGDFVGGLEKGRFGTNYTPYVYLATGTLVKLPIPKNGEGTAVGISDDGWVTGYMDGAGVVWRPSP